MQLCIQVELDSLVLKGGGGEGRKGEVERKLFKSVGDEWIA